MKIIMNLQACCFKVIWRLSGSAGSEITKLPLPGLIFYTYRYSVDSLAIKMNFTPFCHFNKYIGDIFWTINLSETCVAINQLNLIYILQKLSEDVYQSSRRTTAKKKGMQRCAYALRTFAMERLLNTCQPSALLQLLHVSFLIPSKISCNNFVVVFVFIYAMKA
jgi:hypothetical protein